MRSSTIATLLIAAPAFAASAYADTPETAEPSETTVAAVAPASATATSAETAPDDAEAGGISVEASFGAMTSNPWRGDQLAGSNAEAWWVTDNAVSAAVGPGSFGVGVWAAGHAGSGDADFEVPVGYEIGFGSVTTSVGYTAFPTTYTPADATVHEFSAGVGFETGPVSPWTSVHVDPFVGNGAYAAAGADWGTDVGNVSFGAGASFGVSGYEGASFGGQDVGASAEVGYGFGPGFSTTFSTGFSYGFRSEDAIPHASLSLGYGN